MKPYEEKIVFDENNDYFLETQLFEDTLILQLKIHDFEKGSLQYYEQTFTNESLSQQMKFAFGDIDQLFQQCFKKRENYKVQKNGNITFFYTILLKSGEKNKIETLHLIQLEKDSYQILMQENKLLKYKVKQLSKELNSIKNNFISSESFELAPHIYSNSIFQVKNNRQIKKIKDNNEWNQLLLDYPIGSSKVYSFSFRMRKSNQLIITGFGSYSQTMFVNQMSNPLRSLIHQKNQNILIGIVDQNRRDQKTSFKCQGNAFYYGNKGTSYPGNIQKGLDFKENDIVKCIVNLQKGKIEWYVNNKKEATFEAEDLQQTERIFYPYIEVKNISSKSWIEFMGISQE